MNTERLLHLGQLCDLKPRASGRLSLRQQAIDYVAVDVGQAAVDSVVADGQSPVVDAQQVQDCGVDVVDLRGVVSIQGFVAPLV